jgi:hypothetical protein
MGVNPLGVIEEVLHLVMELTAISHIIPLGRLDGTGAVTVKYIEQLEETGTVMRR